MPHQLLLSFPLPLPLPLLLFLPLPLPLPRSKNPQPGLDISKRLLNPSPRRPIRRAENKLSAQVPVQGQTPFGGDLLAEAFLVVLQAAA